MDPDPMFSGTSLYKFKNPILSSIMSTTAPPVAFSPIYTYDNSGYLWIMVILGLIYTILTGLARAQIKRGAYGSDDWLLALATVRPWAPI